MIDKGGVVQPRGDQGQMILHIVIPAIGGTVGLIALLALLWILLYSILVGLIPLRESRREFIRINLATVRGVTGISWFVEPLFNRIDERERVRTKRAQRQDADKIIEDCLQIIQVDFQFGVSSDDLDRNSLRSRIVEETEQTKTDAYPIITETLLSKYQNHIRSSIEALVFAREIELLREGDSRRDVTGEQTSDYNRGVRNALSVFNFRDPGEEEEQFLYLYETFGPAIAESNDGMEMGTSESPNPEVPAVRPSLTRQRQVKLYRDFMNKYYPSERWVQFAEDEYVEYKNKIVELVQSQISIGGVQGDIFGILKRERQRIRKQLEAQEAYLVCSKQIAEYDAVFHYTSLPKKYPRSIRIGKKYLNEPGQEKNEDELEIKMRIVFPQKSYGGSANFIENSLSDIVPEEELVFVSRLSMPFEHGRSEEEFYEVADDPDNVNYVLSKTDFLLRGRSGEDITRAAIDNLRMAEMDVAELLKSLTLRSVVQFATYEEEAFFSEQRQTIERDLDINSIFEWGEQDPEVIAELLRRRDEGNVSKRWGKIATEYVLQIETATPPDFIEDWTVGMGRY